MSKSSNVIRFPARRPVEGDYSDEVAEFVDDLGGFVLSLKAATHSTWEQLGARTGLSPATLLNLADRQTRFPRFHTVYAILRALDDRGLIQHSMFEKYRGFNRADAKRLDKALTG